MTDPADPRRCKALATRGEQCWNAAEDGETCPEHSKEGKTGSRGAKQKSLYRISRIQARLAEFVEHAAIDSLEEEIATLRCLIDEDVETAEDAASAATRARNGFLAVEKLVKTQHSLKETQGSLIPREALLRFGQSLSQVITTELRGLPGWEVVSDRIGAAIVELTTKLAKGEFSGE